MITIPAEVSERFDGRWWRRLRRSFKVPDLVRDTTAFWVITHEMATWPEEPDFDVHFAAYSLVRSLLVLGEAGELEDLFIRDLFEDLIIQDLEEDVFIQDKDKDSWRYEVVPGTLLPDPYERAKKPAADEGRGLSTSGSRQDWRDMWDQLVKRFMNHLKDFPGETVDGWPREGGSRVLSR